MAGPHTLEETERQVSTLLSDLPIDFESMTLISNLFRAGNAVKNHLERSVLAKYELSWTAFVVLWVIWIWEPIETRDIAAEVGTSKPTLTGVLKTLEKKGWIIKSQSKTDKRLVIVTLTKAGKKIMRQLFPEFNKEEIYLAKVTNPKSRTQTANSLRAIAIHAQLTQSRQE